MEAQRHAGGYDRRNSVRNGLRIQDSLHSPNSGEDEDRRDKTDSLPASAKQKACRSFAEGKKQRGIHGVKAEQDKRASIGCKGFFPNSNYFRISVCKLRDNLRWKEDRKQSDRRAENGRPQNGKPDRLAQTVIFLAP